MFASIGLSILSEVTSACSHGTKDEGQKFLAGSTSIDFVTVPADASDTVNPATLGLCKGSFMLIGTIAAAFSAMNMFRSHETWDALKSPAQHYVEGLRRLAKMDLKGSLYRCGDSQCEDCGPVYYHPSSVIPCKLEFAFLRLRRYGLCLECLEEPLDPNKPFQCDHFSADRD